MWGRLALPLALIAMVLSITPSYAGTTYKVVGHAALGATGEAYIRQIANGRSHIAVRAGGLTPGSQPVWRVHTGDTCAAPGAVFVTSAPMTVTQDGKALSVLPNSAEVPMGTTTPVFVAVRLYESALGPELACGRVVDQPFSVLNSAHWW